jgi:hypothetical protein
VNFCSFQLNPNLWEDKSIQSYNLLLDDEKNVNIFPETKCAPYLSQPSISEKIPKRLQNTNQSKTVTDMDFFLYLHGKCSRDSWLDRRCGWLPFPTLYDRLVGPLPAVNHRALPPTCKTSFRICYILLVTHSCGHQRIRTYYPVLHTEFIFT